MDIQNKVIAVTGASGMLGVYICRALLARGARVRGVVRNPEKAAFLADEGVTFAQADLEDRPALARAFEGADAIVSNAALYSITNHRWTDNMRANKQGTENVYEAAAEAGVNRAVHISTFGVYKLRPGRPLDEDSPQVDGSKRQGGAYRASKQVSEVIARELCAKHGIGLTVLRPTGVYGARDTNLIRPLMPLMKSPFLPLPTGSFPLVYAGDVAEAVAGSLLHDVAIDRTYNTGGNGDSILQFGRAWREAAGKRFPLFLPIPLPLHFKVDNSRAEAEIGFRNRSFVEGLREVLQEEQA